MLAALGGISSSATADTYRTKWDNQIVALDLRTGELRWTFPRLVSNADFAVYRDGLVAHPDSLGKPSYRLYLDPSTGEMLLPFDMEDERLLAQSAVHNRAPPVVLENGWVLRGFDPGNSRNLSFHEPEHDRLVWHLPDDGYHHSVRAVGNMVVYATDAVIRAFVAGNQSHAWEIDLNALVTGRAKPLSRVNYLVNDGTIYAQSQEHLFAFDAGTGKLRWHHDLTWDLGLPFYPDRYGEWIRLAVDENVLIAASWRRVIALDLDSDQYLWVMAQDSFPSGPRPAAYDGMVYLIAGQRAELSRSVLAGSGGWGLLSALIAGTTIIVALLHRWGKRRRLPPAPILCCSAVSVAILVAGLCSFLWLLHLRVRVAGNEIMLSLDRGRFVLIPPEASVDAATEIGFSVWHSVYANGSERPYPLQWRSRWHTHAAVPFALFATYPAAAFVFNRLRRLRRRRLGLCDACAYDLRGNESGVCPECGNRAPSESRHRAPS